MDTDRNNIHVPFSQLSLQELFTYWLAATIAMQHLYPWSPTRDEYCAALACIWDGEELTPADALHFGVLAKRLEPLLFKFAGRGDRVRIIARQNAWKSGD